MMISRDFVKNSKSAPIDNLNFNALFIFVKSKFSLFGFTIEIFQ